MNHYQRFGLEENASLAEIRAKYLELARVTHPDIQEQEGRQTTSGSDPSKHHSQDGSTTHSHDEMSALNEAYRVLSNPDLRAQYDQSLRPPQPAPSPVTSQRSSSRRQPWGTRVILIACVIGLITVILSNFKSPQRRNLGQELNAVTPIVQPHFESIRRGEGPTLKETLDTPSGHVLRRLVNPTPSQFTPESCLRAFPDQLRAK